MREVVALCGPAGSGKTTSLLTQYTDYLQQHRAPRSDCGYLQRDSLWVCRQPLSGQEIRQSLLDARLSGVMAPQIFTPLQLASHIVQTAAKPYARLEPIVRRDFTANLLREMVSEGELKALRPFATSNRLIDFVVNTLGRLQRSGIDIETMRRWQLQQEGSRRHHELVAIYDRYLRLLASRKLCDDDSSPALASLLLQRGEVQVAKLDLLIIDGLREMGGAEFTLLQQHVSTAKRTFISFLCGTGKQGGRAELFAPSSEMLHRWQTLFPEMVVKELVATPTDWPAREHLANHLFRNPRELPAPPQLDSKQLGIEVIESASNRTEWRTIVGAIKERLHTAQSAGNPVGAGDIVVAVRNLADAAPRIRRACEEFGVPAAIDAAQTLSSAPTIRTVIQLLEFHAEDWPFRRLLDVIGNRLLSRFDDTQRAHAEWLVREFQLPGKRTELMELVHRYGKGSERPSPRLRRLYAASSSSVELFERLEQGCRALPSSGPMQKWVGAIEQMAELLGLDLEPQDGATWSDSWRRLRAHLDSLAHARQQIQQKEGAKQESLSFAEFSTRLMEVAWANTCRSEAMRRGLSALSPLRRPAI